MTVRIKHTVQSTNSDGSDTSLIQKAAWNGYHTLEGITTNTGNPNGVVSGTVGDLVIDISGTGKLWQNTDGAMAWAQIGASATSPLLGSGVEGGVNFDGVATVLGLAPTGTTPKIYTLTRDIFPSSILIAANVTIDCANYAISCTGAILGASQTTSIIHNGGKNGVLSVAGTTKAAGRFGATIAGGSGSGGGAGNNGAATTVAPPNPWWVTQAGGTPGTAGAGASTAGGAGTQFGTGGGGGGANVTAAGNAGGTGGGVTVTGPTGCWGPAEMVSGRSTAASTLYQYGVGGAGGGAIASAGVNAVGGGGGSGAGGLLVCAASISTCLIHADGGVGADGSNNGATTGASGGGGGGGGGACIVLAGSLTNVTTRAAGGAGGAGFQIGAGSSGKAGGSGAPGRVILLGL